MRALAVTDHGNLFALKSFYDSCYAKKKAFEGLPPIKPILGCEAYVTSTGDYRSRDKSERRFHLCLHAKNLTGYHNLVRLISEAHINGVYYNRPRIDHKLLEKYHEGLHCSSACIAGEVSYYLDDGFKGGNDIKKAEEIAKWYKDLFGNDYSLEVMLHPSSKFGPDVPNSAQNEFKDLYARQVTVMKRMLELGKKLDIRVIATNDVHFLDKDDDDSHDVLLALSTGKKMSDESRMIYTGEEWFKGEKEMRALFAENPELIINTLEVADLVEEYKLDSDPIMPKFEIPEQFGTEEGFKAKYDEATLEGMYPEGRVKKFGGYDKAIRIQFEAEYLAEIVWQGAKKRWGEELPKDTVERVQFELDTVRTMGFPGYFLIVHDYIAAARRMGVWVGPGRGSAAGSAVAYALGITNVDPLKFDLLFERFLNPDRISMPDIDVDFDDAGREKVIDYVTRKYGADHVAHIVTFGQMAAKSAIKDVGRVMEYNLADTNKLAGYVPDTPKITLAKARKESPDLDDAFNSSNEVIAKLMERAAKLEGSIRQPGVHACGIIISRDPLIETLPVMPTPEKGGKKAKDDAVDNGDKLLTTQYDGHFVEPVGLLKMDFLGLKTLTVEKECVALLGANNPRVPEFLRNADGVLDTDLIPDDDKQTYELFGRGETTGLFQFESPGMKKWLEKLQPEKLTDLVAMNALYRPGPMDYIPSFVNRKQGKEEITYDHPLMETHLKDTYGVTVYQEQVMLLSRLLAGFSRGDSDKLRKAMGKKLMDIMNELKAKFIDGCLANPEFVSETIPSLVGYELTEDKKDVVRDAKGMPDKERMREYTNLDLSKPDDAKVLILKIWADWEAFASYAFNKSHAVCYAWVAYQTGYLKAHYPAEFMCAQISSEIGNFDKLPGFVAEAQEMGLKLLLPDVNESGTRFVPTADAKGIRYGLGGIKGVGTLAAEAIVAEREANGPYTGFIDFCMRLAGSNAVNKRVLENLTRVGAFSTLEANRAKLFNNIEYALKKAVARAKEKASAQTDFFGLMAGGEETYSDDELAPSPAFAPAEDLKNERDMLGVYVSGNPLSACQRLVSELSVVLVDKQGAEPLPFTMDMIERKKAERDDESAEEEIGDEALDDASDDEEMEVVDEKRSIEDLLQSSDEKDWALKGLARNAVRAEGKVSPTDKAQFDKAVNKLKPKIKKSVDKILLKKLDVRAVGVLDGCFVKTPRPRPDGSIGQKWAILSIDDGKGRAEGAAFAKVWEKCSDLEYKVDQLVLVCGELSHKVVYAKEDAAKLNPQVGDLNFTLKEAYLLEDAMPLVSNGLRIKLQHQDPQLMEKVAAIRDAAEKSPGKLPIVLDLVYENGTEIEIDLGYGYRVAVTLSFLSELAKVIPQSDTTFAPESKIYLAPREPKPWE